MEPKKEKPKIALGYDNPETEDVEVIFFDSDDLIGSVITDAAIDPERLARLQETGGPQTLSEYVAEHQGELARGTVDLPRLLAGGGGG